MQGSSTARGGKPRRQRTTIVSRSDAMNRRCVGRRERVGQSRSEQLPTRPCTEGLVLAATKIPPDFAARRSPGSCEKMSSSRLFLVLPDRQPASEAPIRHPAMAVLSTVPGDRRTATTSWPSPLRALPSAWPRALLSSLLRKISQRRPLPVLPSSQRASPRPLQPASWPVQPWPWPVLLSSRPVLPRPWRPAFWPALLLP